MPYQGFVIIKIIQLPQVDYKFIELNQTIADILDVKISDIKGMNYSLIQHKFPYVDDLISILRQNKNKEKLYSSFTASSKLFEIRISIIGNEEIHILIKPFESQIFFPSGMNTPLELFNRVFEHTIDACFLIFNRIIIGCNKSSVEMMKAQSIDDILGKTPFEISPEYQECGTPSNEKARLMMDIARDKGSHIFEWIHKRFNNELFYAEVSLTYFQNAEKESFLTIIRDISDKIQNQKELIEREELYRMLAENSSDVIWLMNTKLETIYMSPTVYNQLGYTVDEYLLMPLDKRLPAHSFEIVRSTFEREFVLAINDHSHNTFTLEVQHIHKNGSLVWGEINLSFIRNSNNEIVEILGVTRNIDERKKISEQLFFEKERYRAIIDAYDGLLYICSKDNVIEYMNQNLINRIGFDATGKKNDEVLHSICDQFDWKVNLDVLKGNTVKNEIYSQHDNHWYMIRSSPIYKPDGTISQHTMIQDITESKRTEITIKESETQFRILSEASPMAVFIYQGNQFKYVNPALEKLTKYSSHELLQMNFYDLVHEEFKDLVKDRGLQRQQGIDLPKRYEFKIVDKEKNEIWIDFNGTYIQFEGQGAALGTAYNITERKNAEEALRLNEEKYRMLVQNQTDLIIKLDPDNILEYASPSYCQVFEKTEEEIIGKKYQPVLHEDDLAISLEELQKIKNPPYTTYTEVRMLTASGWKWFSWSGKAVVEENGKIRSIIGVGRDITSRKEVINKLSESEERFRSLVELAVDGIVIGDQNGIITGVNKRFLEITQKELSDVIGKHIEVLFDEEVLKAQPLRFDLLLSGKTLVVEREIKTKSGESIIVEMHSKRMPNGTYQAFFRDVTQRKIEGNILSEQKRFLETLIGNLPGIIYRCKNDRNWSMEFIGGQCMELTGYDPDDFIMNKKRSFNSIIREDYREPVWEKWQKSIQNKEVLSDEYMIVAADGSEKWVYEQGTGVYDENNHLVALEGFIMDITDRKLAEDALVKSQFNYKMLAGYNQLLSRAALIFTMADSLEELEMMITSYFQKLTSAPISMLLLYNSNTKEFSLKHYFFPDEIKLFIYNMYGDNPFMQNIKINEKIEKDMLNRGVLKTGQLDEVFLTGFTPELLTELEKSSIMQEAVVSTLQRQGKLIGINASFMQNSTNVPDEILKTFSQLAGFALSRKRSEIELIEAKEKAEQSDKMKSIFLANISHEVKTPMNAILGFTELLEKPILELHERLKYTEIISKAGNQLLGIIDDLIDLAKIETGQLKIVYSRFDIVQLLRNLHEMMLIRFANKGLGFHLNIQKEQSTFSIESDPLRVKQILINLLDNAFKYTNSGEVSFGYNAIDDYIQFYVKDTGIGVSPSDSSRIFERFVKLEDGHSGHFSGKGLGLSISKSLAEMLGGQIHLESAVHQGSVFYLTLPLQPKKN